MVWILTVALALILAAATYALGRLKVSRRHPNHIRDVRLLAGAVFAVALVVGSLNNLAILGLG